MMNSTKVTACNCCIDTVMKQESSGNSAAKKTIHSFSSVMLSILIAFFPKCPICWAVYMSALGSFGIAQIPYMEWLLPVLISFLILHLWLLYKKISREGYGPFLFSLIGTSIMIIGRFLIVNNKPILIAGMICIFIGSLWNAFSIGSFKEKFSS